MAGMRPVAQGVKRQLTAPSSWMLVGVFALLSGGAFVASLNAFLDQSSQALSIPPLQPVNLNQLLIRPYLMQVGLAALLVLPLLTARAHTQPLDTDALESPSSSASASGSRVLATFAGVIAVYKLMLLTSAVLVGLLFLYGAPEFWTTLCGYLGLLLTGAAFIAVALLVSSLATSALAAGIATFAMSFALATTTWLSWWGAPGVRRVLSPVSVGGGLNDFAKGVVDSGYVVSCLTIIALGLFLTRCALEPARSER